MKYLKTFASDNNSGVHPEIFKALEECNKGHVVGYGDDPYTHSAIDTFKQTFGADCEVYFVYGGTGANVLAISAACRPFESVICATSAHINVDECGAPEKFSGCKLIDIPTMDGKLTPALIKPYLKGFDFEHHSQPKLISITQPTEYGTIYSIGEMKALRELADNFGLLLHVDGARLANAAVYLNKTFREITTEIGIDILSFGGNKNGLMFGEALVFLNPGVSENFKYIRKQGMQLHSKMRFISAQFAAYLQNQVWKINAAHSNAMAHYFFEKIKYIPAVSVTQPIQTNAIFAKIPKEIIADLQKESFFYVWDEEQGEVRWMCSFDTTEEDIDNFIETLRKYL